MTDRRESLKLSIAERNAIDVVKALAEKDALNAIADRVLAYRPKPKSKPARKRQRRKKKIDEAS